VLPRELIGQMNMKQYIDNNLKKGVVVRVFPHPAEALAWLEQQ
jgi:hypothetical protein